MLVLISGPCGSGKTTVSRILAEEAEGRSVHIHTDDMYAYIRRGYIPPWQEEAGDQNETVIRAVAACAKQYALDGYQVYVDGVIGPWFLGPWQELASLDVRYVVLRPEEEVTLARAMGREKRAQFPLKAENVTAMWRMFAQLGQYERDVLNTSLQTPRESAAVLQKALAAGQYRLKILD